MWSHKTKYKKKFQNKMKTSHGSWKALSSRSCPTTLINNSTTKRPLSSMCLNNSSLGSNITTSSSRSIRPSYRPSSRNKVRPWWSLSASIAASVPLWTGFTRNKATQFWHLWKRANSRAWMPRATNFQKWLNDCVYNWNNNEKPGVPEKLR